MRPRTAAAVAVALALTLPVGAAAGVEARPDAGSARAQPLAGRVVVIDPGHQLGNHNFPRQINRLVPAGGFRKACNTTGTATNGGFSEATFAWRVARRLQARLVFLGAKVVLTRTSNRQDRWGPCVDTRGRAGNKVDADLKLSIHGDGTYASGARGFHVIAPTDRRRWTHDIFRSSRALAVTVRRALREAGFPAANYIAGGDGLDFRSDLGTLNLSDVPTVMVELGNMRSRRDARRMTSTAGQSDYADGLRRAVLRYLTR
ncbi:N-acetylmuramoyl-L-alanine amidase [Nocardioides szechwanensis]|uniref:N-acetylmuramoyl-L-alanine amidase family protein n=1 Tax=Nocardioides szechwanensis TaxID=1005944 RepID=UPI000B885F2F|nr:N-acetylmuramoyl-L-alanine amidase [Nocardioides szechwanensis]GEP36140.1 N-acetylmuramoyl-L-alanine amidase [Nocardioides szechwanensis]